MTATVQHEPLHSLTRLFGPGQVLTDPVDLLTYEIDAAIDRGRPEAVVFPASTEDVSRLARWAVGHGVPLVARGAGTGLSGGAVAEHGGVIVEFSRLNRILELDIAGRSVVVEPGVVNLKLDEHVKKHGLYYPPDPASGRSATLGGNVAENAGGPHCFKYGVTTNYMIGLEAVLTDGRCVRFGGRALDYPEYDFVGLLTGSEGTLGVITRITARLLRNPPAVKTMMAAFDSAAAAGEAVSAIIARGLVPATLEMMDRKMMRIIEDFAHAGLPVDAGAALIIEVDGFPESLAPQMDEIVALLREHAARDLRVAQTAAERDQIWYGRKSAAGAMARLSPSYYLLDGTVPRSRLAHTLQTVNHICDDLELRVGYVFHAGDGNLHPFILIEDPRDPALMARVFEAGRRIMEACVAEDGSLTGEHGVGIEKRKFMPLMHTADELRAMLDVKAVFDPGNLMNPGKIFPPEPWETSVPNAANPLSEIMPGRLVADRSSPTTTQAAADLLREALAAGRSVRVRGAGTKSTRLPAADVVLDTAALRGLRRYAPQDLYVTAGAGTPLTELQGILAADRMWVPLISPWPASTLGGIVAANFNAPLRMRYGAVRDLVLAATVILPDGRAIRAGRPVVKNVAGYDLPKLFVGSHGTLGLIADVTFKLAPLPRARASLVAPADDLAHALDWGRRLLPVCLTASALLLCRGDDAFSPAPFKLVYTAEGLPEDVAAELAQARGALQAAGATGLLQVEAPSGSEAWAAWVQARAKAEPLVRVGVPPGALPALLGRLSTGAAFFFADLAAGMVYLSGPVDLGALRVAAQAAEGYAVLLAAPEAFSDASDSKNCTPDSLDLMRRLKARWDPRGLLNPGAWPH